MKPSPYVFGRITQGEMSPNAKMTEEQVVEVLLCHRAGIKPAGIGARTGVSRSQIYSITKRITWSHIRLADRFTPEQLEREIESRRSK